MKFLAFSQTKLGSSLLPAHGSGGARATIKIKAPQKNRAPLSSGINSAEKQKGKKEGGLGEGIFALLRIKIERFRFSLIKRNIRQYGGQAPQKNFLFLLKEKIAREKIKKCRENFSVLVCRSGAEASGNAPYSCSGFSRKKVRISFRIRSRKTLDWRKPVFCFSGSAGARQLLVSRQDEKSGAL